MKKFYIFFNIALLCLLCAFVIYFFFATSSLTSSINDQTAISSRALSNLKSNGEYSKHYVTNDGNLWIVIIPDNRVYYLLYDKDANQIVKHEMNLKESY
jgi:hypothetical protein